MHFTESTEPSPQKSQSGQGVFCSVTSVRTSVRFMKKDFLQKSVIDAR